MSSSASRAKRDRERIRQERAARKVARRVELSTAADENAAAADRPRRAESDVLAELAAVHRRFEDGAIEFDEFEVLRNELVGELDAG